MMVGQRISPLFTDLYELTMAAALWEHNRDGEATFSLYLRRQPHRGYYVAAGLAPALAILEAFRFNANDIDYLNQLDLFKPAFLDYLRALKFTGNVRALPEGCLFFPDEPIVEVNAPLIQAQLLETCLINTIGLHTLVATKAARCVHAASGRKLVDFALRRTQGLDAGMAVARSSYLVGFEATSNVLAGKEYGIPVAGTMAHSFVQSFSSEADAFAAYAATFPERTILLIDTYDTIKGASQAVHIAHRLATAGKELIGVRIDSGDMVALSRQVRQIFDSAGLPQVKIYASGGFDEFAVADALGKGAAIDAFGVGTHMGVSADQPSLELVYKLVRYDDRDVRKLSAGKETLSAPKQVFRFEGADGYYEKDILGYQLEDIPGSAKLLRQVMHRGRVIEQPTGLEEIRECFKTQFALLPDQYKQLQNFPRYPVGLSETLMNKQLGDATG